MGLNMRLFIQTKQIIQNKFFRQSLLLFTVLPLLIICTMSNFMQRSTLKEVFSIITIVALYQLIGQFYWVRTNKSAVKDLTMAKVVSYHKFIGYLFIIILLFHPFSIVIPRFFESGVSPLDAFITMVTTMNLGIILGIVAWVLLWALALTSFFRDTLHLKYKSWRLLHGILSILFVVAAVVHGINIGRHSKLVMSTVLGVLVTGGILVLLKAYLPKKKIN